MTEIEPGSPVHRVAHMLRTEPAATLSRRAIATKLNMTERQVDTFLEPGVVAGWLVVGNDVDLGKVDHLGAKGLDAQPAPARTAPASAPALRAPTLAAPPAKQRRNPRLPRLDVTTLVVTKGEPPPVAQARKGATMHDALFDKLTQDGDVIKGIAVAYRGSLSKAVQTYLDYRPALKAKSAILVRTIDADTIGLWRVPRTEFPGRKSALKAA
jgi:hypothetical protein